MLNPIIYVTFHQDFRRAFKYLLCLQCHSMSSRLRAEAYLSQYGANKNKITRRLQDNNNNDNNNMKGHNDNDNDNQCYNESSCGINVNCHKMESKAVNPANQSADSLSSLSHSSISHDNFHHHHHNHRVFSSTMQSKPIKPSEHGQMADETTTTDGETLMDKQFNSEKKGEEDLEGTTMLTHTTTTTNAAINC